MNGAPPFQLNLNDFTLSWLSILFEGIPFLLFGTLISGFIDAFVPSRLVRRLLPSAGPGGCLVAGLLGIVFPMCECGIVPVMRRLMAKGVPPGCAVAYMLAAPIVNPITFLSTLAAFKGQDPWLMTLARMGFGYAVAVTAGLFVSGMNPRRLLGPAAADLAAAAAQDGPAEGESKPFGRRCAAALRCAVHDFLDVAMYLILGAALAAVFNTGVNRAVIEPLAGNIFTATATLMAGAVMLSLCSTSDAFIAATLTMFPPAAKLAFLVYGPMFDVKLAFMYSAVFRRGFVAKMALALAAGTAFLALLFHFRLP